MAPLFPRIVGDVLACIVSLLLAFFGVFNSLFSDIFSTGERIWSWVFVFGVYAVASALITLGWPSSVRRWRWWFGVPVAVVVAWVMVSEPGTVLVDCAAGAAAIIGVLLGTWGGRRLRNLKNQSV